MCCHLARPPERLVLDPNLHQGLRRKTSWALSVPLLITRLRGFFHLFLWSGPNHGCQFSPLLLGRPELHFSCPYPSSMPHILLFLSFRFSSSSHGCLFSVRSHLTQFFDFGTYTMIVIIPNECCSWRVSAMAKVNSALSLFLSFNLRMRLSRDAAGQWRTWTHF